MAGDATRAQAACARARIPPPQRGRRGSPSAPLLSVCACVCVCLCLCIARDEGVGSARGRAAPQRRVAGWQGRWVLVSSLPSPKNVMQSFIIRSFLYPAVTRWQLEKDRVTGRPKLYLSSTCPAHNSQHQRSNQVHQKPAADWLATVLNSIQPACIDHPHVGSNRSTPPRPPPPRRPPARGPPRRRPATAAAPRSPVRAARPGGSGRPGRSQKKVDGVGVSVSASVAGQVSARLKSATWSAKRVA